MELVEFALDKSGTTCQKLWVKMSLEQRLEAANHFWDKGSEINHALRTVAVAAIAKRRGTRIISIWPASPEQVSTWTSGTLQLPEEVAGSLVRLYLLHEQQEMIVAFLNDLQIPHAKGLVLKDFDLNTVPEDQLAPAAHRLAERFGSAATELYFSYTATQPGAWGEVGRKSLRSIIPESKSLPSEEPITVEPAGIADEWLTNLDGLLNRAIAATVAGSPGALDADQLEDVIGEMLQTNPHRAKTYFHKGYLDVRLERPVQAHFREENQDRRLWYLAGAIQALEDRSDRGGILDLFTREKITDLGREQTHRSGLAAGPIFKALCEEGRVAAAVDFLSADSVFHAGLFEWTLDFGTRLLRVQEIESALKLFELLDLATQRLSQEQFTSIGRRYFDLKRRQAHCLRLQRHFGDATKILRGLLKEEWAPERSAMTVDIALMGAGFRGLLDIVIPGKDLSRFIGRLEQMRPALESAESLGGNTAHATYCLGVLAIAKNSEHYRAAEWLDRSVTNILRHDSEYDLEGLLSRARFYLGLAIVETDDTSAEKAGALFKDAINSGLVPPDLLLKRYIDGLSIVSTDQAIHAAEIAISKLGASRVLGSILGTEIPSQSGPILSQLLECALDEKRSGTKRFENLRSILRHAISGNYNEIAFDALDGMTKLAREGVCTDDFLTLLEDQDHYHPAWSTSDAAWTAARLYERGGKLIEARQKLASEFHHTLFDKRHDYLNQANEVLTKLRELGASESELSTLEVRLPRLQGQSADNLVAEDLKAIPVRITVVGADEWRADYDAAICDHISAQLGAVQIEFRHTGWSGRCGPVFDEMRATLDRSDAVVVSRLLRTGMGHMVREYAKLWIGCAGDSPSSVERAIRIGVDLVRKEKRLARAGTGQR